MRVISGTYKGRLIQTVPNKLTRPTTDKVKESLFNRIGPFFSGGICLDLFAGSGGLGIEALSRGIEHVIFVDQQRQAVEVIKNNLSQLNVTAHAEVYRNDAFRALKAVAKRNLTFSIIFLDPPYQKGFYQRLLEEIAKQNITDEQTVVVCEHEARESLPTWVGTLEKVRTEKYGSTTAISLYRERKN
ncbi:16S rRNA (guanine(966)-N(2))-methyltransferase RsmD [Amphibacillus cookii]|uniref:16S rRNA (guanine(966)-N(2))-methyltransferase RsmD n=1 Tax=Amphibacillus cookii TaxID=767787 RepID=UPI00195BBFE2|nr:16S rRNA (guanine(966)-N(2))-methyltransferase RsmD [Amphibacillus cookii]MBM7540459.1 16S rRNA (guanine(966)-N(2))-methyltransferase RsmD [Amphibacillus cookii]